MKQLLKGAINGEAYRTLQLLPVAEIKCTALVLPGYLNKNLE